MGGVSSKPMDRDYVLKIAPISPPPPLSPKKSTPDSKLRSRKTLAVTSNTDSLITTSKQQRNRKTLAGSSAMITNTNITTDSLSSSKRKNATNNNKLSEINDSAVYKNNTCNENLLESTIKGIKIKTSLKCDWILKKAPSGFATNILSNKSIKLERVIGRGLMATVAIAKLENKNIYFALKKLSISEIDKYKDHRHVKHELEILTKLNSPFCIKYFGKTYDQDSLYFILELAAGGELFRRLSRKQSFGKDAARFYAIEIFAAIEHVQELGYVFRDLKPENVMLDEYGHCKLIDFGFVTKPDVSGMMKTICGTPAYLSPEQLNRKFTDGYTKIVDFWSLGVLIYELHTGSTPFARSIKDNHFEIYLRVLKGRIKYPRGMDSSTRDIVSKLLHPDKNKRLIDPNDIKRESFFDIDWLAVYDRRLIPPFIPKFQTIGDDRHFDKYPGESFTIKEKPTCCAFEGF